MTTTVPFVDLASQQAEIFATIQPRIEELLRTGAFVGGPAVSRFEEDFATFCGAAHCVGVANGTDALELAFRAAGVGAGDEVIIPANTFIATAEAVSRAGARVVFADVDENSLLLDPLSVKAVASDRTRVVVPVHLYGQIAPMDDVLDIAEALGSIVVEDAAQSHGATQNGVPAGSRGLLAATSFYPGKNLGAAGDAGAVLTSDPRLAAMVRRLANHGGTAKYVHEVVGFNSRLDSIHAIVLAAKLAHLARWNESRRVAAARYTELLSDVPGVRTPATAEGNVHVWHLYVVRVEDRDRVLQRLTEAGIGAGLHYPIPLHLTPAFGFMRHGRGDFPVAEAAAEQILSLPMFPHITEEQQIRVVEALRSSV